MAIEATCQWDVNAIKPQVCVACAYCGHLQLHGLIELLIMVMVQITHSITSIYE